MSNSGSAARTGTAETQAALWNPRARDHADVMEGCFHPLYESAQ